MVAVTELSIQDMQDIVAEERGIEKSMLVTLLADTDGDLFKEVGKVSASLISRKVNEVMAQCDIRDLIEFRRLNMLVDLSMDKLIDMPSLKEAMSDRAAFKECLMAYIGRRILMNKCRLNLIDPGNASAAIQQFLHYKLGQKDVYRAVGKYAKALNNGGENVAELRNRLIESIDNNLSRAKHQLEQESNSLQGRFNAGMLTSADLVKAGKNDW